MSPRLEREAAMDDMADYAVAARPSNLIDTFAALPTERLVEEAHAMQARMLGTTPTRDWALIVAMTNRLQRAVIAHAVPTVNREALDGALWLDLRVPA